MSPYVDTTAGLPQSTMINLQQQGLQTGSYYEASLQQQIGMHGDHSLQHSTRAHPQTVSGNCPVKVFVPWSCSVVPGYICLDYNRKFPSTEIKYYESLVHLQLLAGDFF